MTGVVLGRVVAKDGSPWSGATVAIEQAEAPVPDIAVLTSDDGAFALNGLPPGELTLRARLESGQAGCVIVQLVADSTVRVTITVENK